MRFKPLLIIALFASACAALPIPGFSGGGKTEAHKTESSSSSRTEEMHVNGRPVDVADNEMEPQPAAARRPKKDTSEVGKTCHKVADCDSELCFIGNRGDLGYCSKMCNSWSDCPSHWECKRPSNAPQKICVQDNW